MAKNIFIVDAYQINGQGTFTHISGYPKTFSSESYEGDVDKALKRATGAFATAWAGFCAVDNMQLQMVTLMDVTGLLIDKKTVGELVQPAPEPEPEET
jgi:hypothetical protein